MPIFDTQKPLSEFYNSPNFARDAKSKMALKLLGFNQAGMPTGWGKLKGWLLPGASVGMDKIAQHIADKAGASDTAANVGQMVDNDISKLGTEIGVAEGIAGGITGNPQLLQQGIKQTLTGATALAGDVNEYNTEGTSNYYDDGGPLLTEDVNAAKATDPLPLLAYPSGSGAGDNMFDVYNFNPQSKLYELLGVKPKTDLTDFTMFGKDENEMKALINRFNPSQKFAKGALITEGSTHEQGGIHLVDSKTGKKVGEMEVGERIFSREDNAAMENLFKKGDVNSMGKLVMRAMKKHGQNKKQFFKEGGKPDGKDGIPEGYEMKHLGTTYIYENGLWRNKHEEYYANPTATKTMNEEAAAKIKSETGQVITTPKVPTLNEMRSKLNSMRKPVNIQPEVKADTVAPVVKREAGATEAITPVATNKLTGGGTEEGAFNNAVDSSIATDINNNAAIAAGTGLTGEGGGGLAGFDPKSILEYIPDVTRLALGINGANDKLPTYEIPDEWRQHVADLKEKSIGGLTGQEEGAMMNNLDRTYAYDVNNISNMAGGSAGVALGNLGRAAATRNAGVTNMGLVDQQVKEGARGEYGRALGTNLDLSRMIFGDKYNKVMNNKTAGAQLAADALSDINNRMQYNKSYGPGSNIDELQKTMVEENKYLADIYKGQMENGYDLTGYNPNITGFGLNDLTQYLLTGVKNGN